MVQRISLISYEMWLSLYQWHIKQRSTVIVAAAVPYIKRECFSDSIELLSTARRVQWARDAVARAVWLSAVSAARN